MGSIIQQLVFLKATVGDDDHVTSLLSNVEEIFRYREILVVLKVGSDLGNEDMVAILFDEDHHLNAKDSTDLEKASSQKES